jgi:hypothetical protein
MFVASPAKEQRGIGERKMNKIPLRTLRLCGEKSFLI